MKRTLIALTLGLALSGSMALALTPDEIVSNLQAAGYSRVEVRVGPTQIKVEAIRGTEKLEVVYDAATGTVLKTETQAVRGDDSTTAGVSVRPDDRDFVRTGRGSSDDDEDHHDDDHTGNGYGHGSNDDDSRDDDRDHGSDDDGSDDNGSDDDGSDDDDDDSSDDDHGSDDADDSDDDSDR